MLRTTDFLYGVGFSLLGSDNMVQIFDEILEWKFCVDALPREISGMSKKLVTATLEVYKAAVTEQLPKPLTVRYAFDLRNLAKVRPDALQLEESECKGIDCHARVCVRAALWIVGDRLIEDEDRVPMLIQLCDPTMGVSQGSFDKVSDHIADQRIASVTRLSMAQTLQPFEKSHAFFVHAAQYWNPPTHMGSQAAFRLPG